MSLVISPITGELITVESDEFNEVLQHPSLRSQFTSPTINAMKPGRVKVVHNEGVAQLLSPDSS